MTQSAQGNLAAENKLMAPRDVKAELISAILPFIFDFCEGYFRVVTA